MRQTAFFASALFAFAGSAPAADQQLMNLVMPDARVVAGVNVEQAKTSAFGTYLLSMMPNDAGFQQFTTLTGFNPRTDLQEILVATSGDVSHRSGLMLARGKFKPDQIADLASKSGQEIVDYNGAKLIAGPKGGANGALAFLSEGIAIAGDIDNVKAALDRKDGANSIDSGLAARVNDLSSNNDAWSISNVPFSELSKGAAAPNTMPGPLQGIFQGDLLKTVQQTSGGIKFGDGVRITAEALASNDSDATALRDVVKFLAGMIQTNTAGQPVATLLSALSITTDGSKLKVNLTIPEAQLESLLKTLHEQAPAAAAHHKRAVKI